MKNVPEKWQLVTDKLKKQERELQIKIFRDFLTTSHIVEKYVEIIEEAKGAINYNRTEKLIMFLILLKRDYMTPTEISKITFRPIDTINKSIDGLNNKGVIRSSQSKTDRRVRKIILTEKGLELAEQFLPIRKDVFREATSCFNNDELKIFDSFLKRLREQMVSVMQKNSDKSRKNLTSIPSDDPFDSLLNNEK